MLSHTSTPLSVKVQHDKNDLINRQSSSALLVNFDLVPVSSPNGIISLKVFSIFSIFLMGNY